VPRSSGVASFNAGPKIVNIDRAVWNFIPDPATSAAALAQGEIDWWENPTIDLVGQIKKNSSMVVTVKDRTGEIGCLRFNQLLPPFNNPAIRRVVLSAVDQREIIEAYAGAEPSLIKTDVGIFVPGTPMASTVGLEITRGPKDLKKIKADLAAAGYNGEKIVVLAATTLPNIWAEAQVATDLLTRIGFNVDMQSLEWGTVVQRRASREPIDKGGWNIFYNYLGASEMSRRRRTSRSAATAPRPGLVGRPIRKWKRCMTRGSRRRTSPRRKRSVRKCRRSSGKARHT